MANQYGEESGKVSREEFLRALEEASAMHAEMGDDARLNDSDEGPELSEAERLAALADIPSMRVDGKPKGSEKTRPLTTKQMAFARGLIEGKTQAQAYKDAYPDAQGSHQSIKTSAWKLARDPRIQTLVNEGWDETVEAMAEDQAAVKRYVLSSCCIIVRLPNKRAPNSKHLR